MLKSCLCSRTTDKSASFYVGDAAGRPGDFASTDKEWAQNVGIPFYTPEQFFWERKDERAIAAL
jgi:histidinol phosphatase-like enzyme